MSGRFHAEAHLLEFGGYCGERAACDRRGERDRWAAQSTDDGDRGGGLRRLPRRDSAPRVLARAAGLATLRRQRKEVSSNRRPRLDQARRADARLVITEELNDSNEGGRMGIIRRCRGTCTTPRRCLEHLW